MLKRNKYIFDTSDLRFLQHKRKWGEKLIRFSVFFGASILLTVCYSFVFHRVAGYPNQEKLERKIEEIKLDYSLLERKIDYSSAVIADMRSSDNNTYRSILDLEEIPSDISEGGAGGTFRFGDMTGYTNTDMMIGIRSKFEDLRTETNIQYNSLTSLTEAAADWKDMWAHLPYIRPVNVTMRLGDGMKFREHHPVWGSPRWHFGQDFCCPIGTEVYATGAGTVYYAGNQNDGFGIKVVIDHGYGYRSIYGHLSQLTVKRGQKVKRGDFIGLSGTTGTSTGPHLHYQIDLYGSHVNPLWYFEDGLSEDEYFEMLDFLTKR
ncbi:MAG TPA: M23 family metallopeptidase [Bacteroidales bacterium]|nr:M23 family metallopeptidase [Bacteroidales bacterium]